MWKFSVCNSQSKTDSKPFRLVGRFFAVEKRSTTNLLQLDQETAYRLVQSTVIESALSPV